MAKLLKSGEFSVSIEHHALSSSPKITRKYSTENGDLASTDRTQENKICFAELTTKVKAYVYLSHFLSAWGDRMWFFAAGLFLVVIAPESLLLTAIFGFASGGTVLLIGPLIGDWVDNTSRLTAARVFLFVQNISVIFAACLVYVVLIFKTEIENYWPDEGLLLLCYAIIIFFTIVANIASIGSTIAVERDWIVEICGRDGDLLASMTATLRRIDQLTLTLAPIVTGQVMTYASTEIGAIFIAVWNLVSVFLEYYLLWKVYNVVPALRNKMYAKQLDKDTETTPLMNSGKCNSIDDLPKLETGLSSRDTCCTWNVDKLLSGIFTLVRGWKTYMKYDVAYAGIGLAMLYMTVLGFDNVTVGYGYTQGLTESVIGIAMAAGAVCGIIGTYIYPVLRRRFGLQRAGLYGLFMEATSLCLCVASVWAPGSPFDPLNLKTVAPAQICEAVINGTMVTDDTSMYHQNMTSDGVSLGNNTSKYIDAVLHAYENSTVKPPNMCVAMPTGPESQISIALLMTGIVLARCGLWLADLAITQQFLEAVEETERGIVNGVQNSMNQLMEMLKFAMVIIAPETETFGVLVLISFCFVLFGWFFYALYSRRVRGHLFHCVACLSDRKKVFSPGDGLDY